MPSVKLVIFTFWSFILAVQGTATTLQAFRLPIRGIKLNTNKHPWLVRLGSWYHLVSNLKAKKQLPLNSRTVEYCSGFFIDKYGTVITAGHCVESTKNISDKDGDERQYKLFQVTIHYGSYPESLTDVSCLTTAFDDLSRIKYHPDSREKVKDMRASMIDLAIIFLPAYEKIPMDCSQPNVGTIQLSNGKGTDRPADGVVAGFGLQAVHESGFAAGYQCAGGINEIDFKYHGRLAGNSSTKWNIAGEQQTPYFAVTGTGKHVNPVAQGTDGVTRLLDGTCKGDSGAPYMVTETYNGKQMLCARGVAAGIGLTKALRPVGQPCTRKGEADSMVDLSYWKTEIWIAIVLRERYRDLKVLPEEWEWDQKPITCPS